MLNEVEVELLDVAIKEYFNFKLTEKYNEEYKYQILRELNEELSIDQVSVNNIEESIDALQKNNPASGSFVHFRSTKS